VADKLSLAERVADADLVVTGEGYLDEQSFAGKAVGGVARLAAVAGVPVLIVAGDGRSVDGPPYISLVERFGHERAWSDAAGCLNEAVAGWLANGQGA
jgi:glycerate kinase